jgi:hypothetical protein
MQRRGTLEDAEVAHRVALAAHGRLDTAFRQYIGERRAPTEVGLDAYGTMVAGAARVRRAGHAIARITALWIPDVPAPDTHAAQRARAALDRELAAVGGWLTELTGTFEAQDDPPGPQPPDPAVRDRMVAWLAEAAGTGAAADTARSAAWANEHLELLRRHEPRLALAAARLEPDAIRRRREAAGRT